MKNLLLPVSILLLVACGGGSSDSGGGSGSDSAGDSSGNDNSGSENTVSQRGACEVYFYTPSDIDPDLDIKNYTCEDNALATSCVNESLDNSDWTRFFHGDKLCASLGYTEPLPGSQVTFSAQGGVSDPSESGYFTDPETFLLSSQEAEQAETSDYNTTTSSDESLTVGCCRNIIPVPSAFELKNPGSVTGTWSWSIGLILRNGTLAGVPDNHIVWHFDIDGYESVGTIVSKGPIGAVTKRFTEGVNWAVMVTDPVTGETTTHSGRLEPSLSASGSGDVGSGGQLYCVESYPKGACDIINESGSATFYSNGPSCESLGYSGDFILDIFVADLEDLGTCTYGY